MIGMAAKKKAVSGRGRRGAKGPQSRAHDDERVVERAAATEIDRDLIALARAFERIAHSVRQLVEHPEVLAKMYEYSADQIARRKVFTRDAATRALVTYRGVRFEDGAPYRDARMLLTEGIVFYARCEENAPSSDNAAARARALAARVAAIYPALRARTSEPKRIEAIRVAIMTKCGRRTMPWKQIVETWSGIQGVTDRWRQDWAEYRSDTERKRTF